MERLSPPKPGRDQDTTYVKFLGQLLGQRLMARDFHPQVAKVQIRIAVMNGYTAPGIPVTETVG